MNKYFIILFLLLSMLTTIGFMIKSYNKRIFQSGIDYCKTEISKENDRLRKQLSMESEKRIKEALTKKSEDDIKATKIVEEIINEKPLVTQSQINNSDINCSDLGSEFAELYNNAIGRRPNKSDSKKSKNSR